MRKSIKKSAKAEVRRAKPRNFVVETNRSRQSTRKVADRINRTYGSGTAEVAPHKTSLCIRGVSLRDLVNILRQVLAPGIGSALIARTSGLAAAWVLSLRGNRLLTRLS
jgi:hypothetical protein